MDRGTTVLEKFSGVPGSGLDAVGMQHLVVNSDATGLRPGGHHEALRLLGVVFDWILVPVEAMLALWGSLLLVALAAWGVWGVIWLIRRAALRLRFPVAPVGGDGPVA